MSVQLINSLDQEFQFENNIVVRIGTTYFGKYQPDSGLVIDSDKLLVSGCSINPTQVDLRRATTQINSTNIDILDGTPDDEFVFSAFIGADENSLVGTDITIYFGRVGESLDFTDYIEINKYIITDITKSFNTYKIKAKSQEDKTQKPVFQQQGTLDTSITNSETSIVVQTDTDSFAASGLLKIGSELIRYSSKAFVDPNTTFTVTVRGDEGSTADSHTAGDQVNFVQKLNENPINMILKLLISSGGGGTYDTLIDGAGIDETLIDVADIESLRDTNFSGETWTLFISDEARLINWIEDNLFEQNNLRLVKSSTTNLITLVRLNTDDTETGEIDDNITVRDSTKWSISKNEIETIVKAEWNWSEGLQKYTRSRVFSASQAIRDVHGDIQKRTLRFKGAQSADNGDTIVADRVNRYLDRFSTPKMTVKLDSFMQGFKYNLGDKIRVTAKHLPQEGGSRGMSNVLELVSRAVNNNTGKISLGFRATSYTNLRKGFISPADILRLGITDQKTFEVRDGTCYKPGYVMELYQLIGGKWVRTSDAPNTILSISGNIVTMDNNWTTILGSDIMFSFARYDSANEEQKAKYAFTVGNSNFFADGSKGYQIIL